MAAGSSRYKYAVTILQRKRGNVFQSDPRGPYFHNHVLAEQYIKKLAKLELRPEERYKVIRYTVIGANCGAGKYQQNDTAFGRV